MVQNHFYKKFFSLCLLIDSLILINGCSINSQKNNSPATPVPQEQTENVPISNTINDEVFIDNKVAFIKKITFQQNQYTMDVETTEMLNGDEAIAKAIAETGCSKERIFDGDCAPSLNNNFYFSKVRVNKTLTANTDVKVFLITSPSMELRESSLEQLKNLFEQTDAFDIKTPFRIEEKNGIISKITQQYIP